MIIFGFSIRRCCGVLVMGLVKFFIGVKSLRVYFNFEIVVIFLIFYKDKNSMVY